MTWVKFKKSLQSRSVDLTFFIFGIYYDLRVTLLITIEIVEKIVYFIFEDFDWSDTKWRRGRNWLHD